MCTDLCTRIIYRLPIPAVPGHRNDPFNPTGAACHRGKPIVSLQSDLICTSSGLYALPDPDFGFYIYIYTYKRDTRVFPLRGFFSKFSIVSQSSLSKFCTRHEALWKVSTRIFRAKIVPIKLSLILAIRFALPKGKRKILDSNSSRNRDSIAHFGMQRLTYE